MIQGNNSAFPRLDQDYRDVGLNVREYFSAMAMQGMLSNECLSQVYKNVTNLEKDFYKSFAMSSVQMADALIAELNKEK